MKDNSIGGTGATALAGALLVNQTLQTLHLRVSAFYFHFFSKNTQLLNQNNPLGVAGVIEVAECLKHNQSLTSISIVEYFLCVLAKKAT